jgi:hypothetical protein
MDFACLVKGEETREKNVKIVSTSSWSGYTGLKKRSELTLVLRVQALLLTVPR